MPLCHIRNKNRFTSHVTRNTVKLVEKIDAFGVFATVLFLLWILSQQL